MPRLNWNEYDFIEALGVLPETDEFSTSHNFNFVKDGLMLEIRLWQYESFLVIAISKESDLEAFAKLSFIVRHKIGFSNDKDNSRLIFYDCVFVESRFWHYSEKYKFDLFDKNKILTDINLVLSTYPRIEFSIN